MGLVWERKGNGNRRVKWGILEAFGVGIILLPFILGSWKRTVDAPHTCI